MTTHAQHTGARTQSNWNSNTLLWACRTGQPLWKTLTVSFKVTHTLPYDLVIPLLDIYANVMTIYVHKKNLLWMFIALLFTITKTWEQPKYPSTGAWMKSKTKLWHIHVTDNCSGIKGNNPLNYTTAQVNLRCFMLSERSQTPNLWVHLCDILEKEKL